jgi:hypothetical protein
LIDHGHQAGGFDFASELLINAGMVAPESTYPDDGNRNGFFVRQGISTFRVISF